MIDAVNGAIHSGMVAQQYLMKGYQAIPIPIRSKNPNRQGWQNDRITFDQVAKRFKPDSNVGLLLGEPSNWLVDVDLDCPEAVAIAPSFLPTTEMISGRPSNRNSHYWYIAQGAKTRQYEDITGKKIVELRSTGTQTLVFPSIHDEDNERYEWYSEGEPTVIDAGELSRIVDRIAVAALLARHWPQEGSRHAAALAISGLLARRGIDKELALQIISAVTVAVGDEEVDDRVRAVEDTYHNVESNRETTGGKKAVELFGARVVDKVCAWLVSGEMKADLLEAIPVENDRDWKYESSVRHICGSHQQNWTAPNTASSF